MLKYIFFLLLIALPGISKADTWLDPEFDEMIDSSIAIVLGEVKHGGTDYAEVKIIKSFKGNISLPVIYVGEFSGRLGPYDTLKAGEKYYFFFRYKLDSAKDAEFLNKFNSRFASLQYYAGKITVENLYYVWTPTSGDIPFDSEGVHAHLVFNRSYKGFNDPLQQDEFEKMLELRINKTKNSAFRDKIYDTFEQKFTDREFPIVLQYLSMLHLIRSDRYTEIIEEAARDTFYLSRYLTAKYLSNLNQSISRALLIPMLNDEDWLVQGEAVRQLKHHDPNIILPLFLDKIKSASKDEAIFSSGIMDPSPKIYDGAFIEMAELFRDLGYKPAAPFILTALKEADWYSTENLADILDSLDKESLIKFYLSKLIPPYSEYHSFRRAVNYLTDNKIPEAKKLLIDYILYIDKSKSDDTDLITKLAVFDDDDVKQFVVSQFLQMYYKSAIYSPAEKKWLYKFINYFSGRKITEIKSEIYSLIDLNDINLSEDSLKYMYHTTKNEYIRIRDSINKILSAEILERGSVLVKLEPNFAFTYAAGYFLDEKQYGINPMYEEVSEEDIPDSTIERFKQVKSLLGFSAELKPGEDILDLGLLGLYLTPFLEQVTEEETGLQFFDTVLRYYIANPDKENFLKFFYLFNKFSNSPSDGYTLEALIKIGDQYY